LEIVVVTEESSTTEYVPGREQLVELPLDPLLAEPMKIT
jgi:hypothetical protein